MRSRNNAFVSRKVYGLRLLSCLSGLRQALKERLTSNPFLDAQVQSHAHWLDNFSPQSGFTKSPVSSLG